MSPLVGERGLFAPALLVARPALTGFVPQPSHLIFGTSSYESTLGRDPIRGWSTRVAIRTPGRSRISSRQGRGEGRRTRAGLARLGFVPPCPDPLLSRAPFIPKRPQRAKIGIGMNTRPVAVGRRGSFLFGTALQAGGHRFDPGTLHTLTKPFERFMRMLGRMCVRATSRRCERTREHGPGDVSGAVPACRAATSRLSQGDWRRLPADGASRLGQPAAHPR